MNTQGSQDLAEAQARSWLGSLLRRVLVPLIVDVLVALYARAKSDPEFQRRVADAFTSLDGATTQEDNDAAALAIQQAIES